MPQEELGTWNFQWQPSSWVFLGPQSSTQQTLLVPCFSCPLLSSATAMEDSCVEAQVPLAPCCLKCRGTEFLSVSCPHKLSGLPESACSCKATLGVSRSCCAWGQSQPAVGGSLWVNVPALVLQGVVLGGNLHLFLFNPKLLNRRCLVYVCRVDWMFVPILLPGHMVSPAGSLILTLFYTYIALSTWWTDKCFWTLSLAVFCNQFPTKVLTLTWKLWLEMRPWHKRAPSDNKEQGCGAMK